ncbi:MAG: LacI family DNA-binding transcriptional regulator [Clostridiales bacterium]|nr:LacI family DNA-binding transcriptional regulator [Clostridiales bacterium]MBR4010167.1 LacI family DNA-binding transcriptional regulator [Clostridiales bacterium]
MSSTIKDVAKMAGVSISTVSKFINGGNVLEENRVQIENAIETLNYQVNTVARGMKTRKTMSVGVLIPSLADYYGVSILSCIDQELYNSGYSTIICDYSQTDPSGASDKINFLINKQIDGIIMQPINVHQEDIDRAAKADVPIVFVDIEDPTIACDSVTIDNVDIAHRITQHFIDNGHKRIGFIGGQEGVNTTDDRVRGYQEALEKAGITPSAELIHLENVSEESGYLAMMRFMNLKNPPTAVFASGNDLTCGAVMYANEKHIKIPDDLSFVGFENQTIAHVYNPTLTIGIQPIRKIGQTAARMLLERMRGEYEGAPRNIRLKAVIDFGASVKKL